jgi:hypothetical protein
VGSRGREWNGASSNFSGYDLQDSTRIRILWIKAIRLNSETVISLARVVEKSHAHDSDVSNFPESPIRKGSI